MSQAEPEMGGKDEGLHGLRPHHHANYYAASVSGPDRHILEIVRPEAEA